MIQRVQSIYLLLAAAFIGLSFALPLAAFSHNGSIIATMHLCGIENVNGQTITHLWAMLVVAVIDIIVALATIFLYKNRRRQIAMTNSLMLLIVVLFIVGIIAVYSFLPTLGNCNAAPAYGVISPLLAYPCTWLARRAIRKDEELVRAAERFR